MNKSDARTYLNDLAKQVETAPEGSITRALAPMLMNGIMEIESIESQMRSELRTIRDRADRAEKALTEGLNMNSLGEFHTAPGSFDRLCAQRQDQWTHLLRTLHVMNEDGAGIDKNELVQALAAKANG